MMKAATQIAAIDFASLKELQAAVNERRYKEVAGEG